MCVVWPCHRFVDDFLKNALMHIKNVINLDCLPVLMLLYIMPAYVMQLTALFNAVCLFNACLFLFLSCCCCCCYCCRPHSTNVLPAESSTRNHVAANSLSPQVARKGSTLSGFVQRSRLEREVGRDLHSNKWEEV